MFATQVQFLSRSVKSLEKGSRHWFSNGRSTSLCFKRHFASSKVLMTFIGRDDEEEVVEANVGESFLDVALDNDLDIEGACGGEIACSTCHIIFDEETFSTLDPRCEEEEDMLDLALGVTETSRLGCQVKVRESFQGITVRIPKEGANFL